MPDIVPISCDMAGAKKHARLNHLNNPIDGWKGSAKIWQDVNIALCISHWQQGWVCNFCPTGANFGAAESYFGLWREDQPNGHGLFRWFDGDLYLGEWNIGKMQGYGVYQYGPDGQYAHDK